MSNLNNLANHIDGLCDTLNISNDCKALLAFAARKTTVTTFDGEDVIQLEDVDTWYDVKVDFKYSQCPASQDPDSHYEEVRYIDEVVEVTGNDENDDPIEILLCEHTKEKLIDILNKNVEI